MTFTFIANPPCNTYDFLYNKEKNPPKLKIDSKKIAKRYDDIGIMVLRPNIDRLIIGFSPTTALLSELGMKGDLEQEVIDLEINIAKTLFHSAKLEEDGLSCVKDKSFKSVPYKHYNLNFHYKPAGNTAPILIQIKPKKEHHTFIRVDMNPSKLSKQGINEFRTFIEGILVCPGLTIPYDSFIAWATISKIEIAVDILGVRPAELEVKTLKGGKQFPCKSRVYKNNTGRIETLYLNVKKGKSSKSYIYDKRNEQLDMGLEPTYGDTLHTRYEWRIENTRAHKLANLKNHCKKINIRAMDYKKFRKLGYVQKLFIGLMLTRIFEKALNWVPAKYQAKYQTLYKEAFHDVWDAELIWSYWKETLETCGLFPKK